MANPTQINLIGDDTSTLTLTPPTAPAITISGVLQGPQGNKGDTGPAGSVDIGYYNITDPAYGAIGNSIFDCTTAIQTAINAANTAGGGTVFVPSGTYKITARLQFYTGVSLLGVGSEASIISQSSTTLDSFYANDAASITIQGILLEGPSSGSGKGINFGWTTAGNVPFLDFKDVKVHNFGGDNIYIETPIVSTFTDVVSQNSSGWGFNWYHAGTSNSFNSCWARDNGVGGYRFYETVYTSLNGCASDGNPINYLVDSASGIAFNGCGSESSPIGVKITNSNAIGFHSCWNYDNQGIAYWVTGSSAGIEFYSCAENTPHAGATACFQYDVGSRGLLSSPGAITTNVLNGVVTVIDDINGLATLPELAVTGSALFTGPSVQVQGTSGTMLLSASPDGANFNIFSNATGTLAFYGSGANTLNVDFLDGMVTFGGGVLIPVVAKGSNYNATTSDNVIMVTGTMTVTLPSAVGVTGYTYNIKNIGLGVVTIATTGGQTVDGSSPITLPLSNMSLTLISDGANWRII